jgi:hypothetical protein
LHALKKCCYTSFHILLNHKGTLMNEIKPVVLGTIDHEIENVKKVLVIDEAATMKRRIRSALSVAGMAGVALAGIGSAAQQAAESTQRFEAARDTAQTRESKVQKSTPQRSVNRLVNQGVMNHTYRRTSGNRRITGGGWPVATDRRRAKKAKNIARNRAAHR